MTSIKLRGSVPTSDYHEFFKSLEREMGLNCLRTNVDLHEPGCLVSDRIGKIILVEHETGLEILFIASSIASLISLVPSVIQGWRLLRNHHWERHGESIRSYEIRRFNEKWKLLEEHIPDFEMNHMMSSGFVNTTIARLLETEMNQVFSKIDSLNNRIEKLEKMLKLKALKSKEKTTTNKRTKSPNIKHR